MTMLMERTPRLVPQVAFERAGYEAVVCNREKANGRICNSYLGEVNLAHPHDVRYRCQKCGAMYLLQKDI